MASDVLYRARVPTRRLPLAITAAAARLKFPRGDSRPHSVLVELCDFRRDRLALGVRSALSLLLGCPSWGPFTQIQGFSEITYCDSCSKFFFLFTRAVLKRNSWLHE